MSKVKVYTGSYQHQFWTSIFGEPDIEGSGEGIYCYELDTGSGSLTAKNHLAGLVSPAALCISPNGKFMFAASDTRDFINYEQSTGGGVYALRIDGDGKPHYVAGRSSCGVRAVDVCCDKTGEYVLVTNCGSIFRTTEYVKGENGKYSPKINYDEGCVVLFKVDGDGNFQKVCDRYVLPEGTPAHPRSSFFGDDDILFIANSGGSAITVMRLDRETEKLVPVSLCGFEGATPRTLSKHPNNPVIFCGDSENGHIETCVFDKATGCLERKSRAELLPAKPDGEKRGVGDTGITPDGRFLYACAYKHAEITVFKVGAGGSLEAVQSVTEGLKLINGYAARNIAVDPTGKFLLAVNPTCENIAVYSIDPNTGMLTLAGENLSAPAPAGICFADMV